MESVSILGVKINRVTLEEATHQIVEWIKGGGKHYVTTPNVEFIMLAQRDDLFRSILNQSDLAIPDSARLSWAYSVLKEKNFLLKILQWPLFVLPKFFSSLPVTTGIDLMENLARVGEQQGFRIGLLGGGEMVAEKAAECLLVRYPKLKISFISSGGFIDADGEFNNQVESIEYRVGSKRNQKSHYTPYSIPYTDILFVAFGQGKQEKWIKRYMDKVDAKVFVGVGGAFDYLSGSVTRAPKWVRNLGLEWLFRLIKQPWRIKRFGALVKFVFLLLT